MWSLTSRGGKRCCLPNCFTAGSSAGISQSSSATSKSRTEEGESACASAASRTQVMSREGAWGALSWARPSAGPIHKREQMADTRSPFRGGEDGSRGHGGDPLEWPRASLLGLPKHPRRTASYEAGARETTHNSELRRAARSTPFGVRRCPAAGREGELGEPTAGEDSIALPSDRRFLAWLSSPEKSSSLQERGASAASPLGLESPFGKRFRRRRAARMPDAGPRYPASPARLPPAAPLWPVGSSRSLARAGSRSR